MLESGCQPSASMTQEFKFAHLKSDVIPTKAGIQVISDSVKINVRTNMMSEFFTLTLIGLLMIISPGPDFAVVTKTSVSKGRVAGVATALGIAAANLVHVSINLLGIGILIAESPFLFTVLKIAGAAYLLYIGYKGIRAKPEPIILEKSTHQKSNSASSFRNRGFISGFMTSILNPKACLFFLSFFSVLLSPKTPLMTQILYGLWLSAMAMLWFVLVALFFTNPIIGDQLKASKHWIERFAGGALMFLGVRLLSATAVI